MSNFLLFSYLLTEVVNMKIELTRDEFLIIMDSLLHNHRNLKMYYKEHTDEKDRIGMLDPKEVAEVYIKLLNY